MFDADIVIVSRLAGVLESALQTETYLSKSCIAEQVGVAIPTFYVFLKNRKKLARVVDQFQMHTSSKNRLYQEKRTRRTWQTQERNECRERETRRARRLTKLSRWMVQWKYDKAVAKIQRKGRAVTLRAIAQGANVYASTVSSYLRKHPHLSKRYELQLHR